MSLVATIEHLERPGKERRRSTDRGARLSTDRLWDANDVARYLKASRSWVYQKAEAGTLPSLRIGGLLRFEPSRIRAFVRGEPGQSNVVQLPRSPRRRGG